MLATKKILFYTLFDIKGVYKIDIYTIMKNIYMFVD